MKRPVAFILFLSLLILSSCTEYKPDQFYGTWHIIKASESGVDKTYTYHYDINFENDNGTNEFLLSPTGTNPDDINFPYGGKFTTGMNKITLIDNGVWDDIEYPCTVVEYSENHMVLEHGGFANTAFKVEFSR